MEAGLGGRIIFLVSISVREMLSHRQNTRFEVVQNSYQQFLLMTNIETKVNGIFRLLVSVDVRVVLTVGPCWRYYQCH